MHPSKQRVLFAPVIISFFSPDLQLWAKLVLLLTSEEECFPKLQTGVTTPVCITLQRSTFTVQSRTNIFFRIVYKHPTLHSFTNSSKIQFKQKEEKALEEPVNDATLTSSVMLIVRQI